MSKAAILEEYRNTVGSDSAKARRLIKRLKYKEDSYLLRCIAQTYLDESRFEDNGGSDLRTSLDERKWRMAEKYIIKAYAINPVSAEVLYTMGEVRKVHGQIHLAIYCFEKIIKTSIRKIAFGPYGRWIAFAKQLLNDSKFELYRLHHDLSRKYLDEYKKDLETGTYTIFKPLKKFLL